jgi:hypothetical protein
MKNIELYGIREGLSMMDGLSGVKLGVFRAKASRIVEKLISDMESFMKSETWKKTDELLGEINKKHAKRMKKETLLSKTTCIFLRIQPIGKERFRILKKNTNLCLRIGIKWQQSTRIT